MRFSSSDAWSRFSLRQTTAASLTMFDNAGATMGVDETLLCSFQVRVHLNNLSHVLIGVDIETGPEKIK